MTALDEMEMHPGVLLEPAPILFVRVEVVEDDMKLMVRKN
jgi:hypothetical protein